MSNDWTIPVYREGYTDPYSPTRSIRDNPFVQQDQSRGSAPPMSHSYPRGPAPGPGPGPGAVVPFTRDPWMDSRWMTMDPNEWMNQSMAYHHRTWEQMNREMERLFPWFPPGEFRPGSEPSALAPRIDDQNYIVEVNASTYQPNEITVKTVSRGGYSFLIVEGKHQTVDNTGYHSVHHFRRQFMVPPDVDPDTFTSRLTPQGRLIIQAPKRSRAVAGEKHVPIQRA